MSDARLIYTGNVIADIVMTIDGLPEVGGDTIASTSSITAGGGYNVMVAASRDGLAVTFAGQYGTGPFGAVVRSALAAGGFVVVQPGLADIDSGYCVALVDANAERTFVTYVGAEGQLTPAGLEAVSVNAEDTVYVTGYSLAHPVNRDSLLPWLDTLPAGVRVITDPSPLIDTLDAATVDRVMLRTDVLSANAREARLLSALDALDAAAAALADRIRTGGLVVVRDGANGCWLAGSGIGPGAVHVPGFTVVAVDTNGAGDAHGGVLAAALSHGLSPIAAARRANAAAAIAVTRSGPATTPHASDIDDFLRSHPSTTRPEPS